MLLASAFRDLQRKTVRYYAEREKSGKCRNCHKEGHYAIDCPEERACNLCFKIGHSMRDCPNEFCFNCLTLGHHSKVMLSVRRFLFLFLGLERPTVVCCCFLELHQAKEIQILPEMSEMPDEWA